MGKYRVFILGENILAVVDGITQRLGFVTTVFTEADSPEQAGKLALSLLHADPKVVGLVRNPADDPFRLVIKEVDQIESFGEVTLPRTGLAWFPEEGSDAGSRA